MIVKVIRVQPKPDYRLCVRFQNSEVRLFDMRPYLNKGIFQELKDERYFKKVRTVSGGIEWPNDQDLSAETLYYKGIPLKKPDKLSCAH